MPKYRITGPDGATYDVTAPEGASEQEVMAYVQSNAPKAAAPKAAPKPPPAVPQESALGRAAGLFARDAVVGATTLPSLVVDPAVSLWNKITGRNDPGLSGSAEMVMDQAGAPRAQNDAERFTGAVNRAVVGGGGYIGTGRALAANAAPSVRAVGTGMAANPGLQIASAGSGASAAELTRQGGGSEGAQFVAGLAGGLAPGSVQVGGAASLRGLLRGSDGAPVQSRINDFRAVGASPSVGQATGNSRTQGLESLLAASPTSVGVMSRAAENQADDIGASLRSRADAMFPNASAERAGKAVERGVDSFAGNVKAVRDRLYQAADQHIPPQTPTAITNTQQALVTLTTPNPGARATTAALVNPKIAQLAQNIAADAQTNGGRLSYEALKAVRSRIGQELSDFSLSADRPTAEYKRLYAALSADMEAAAQSQGPQAVAAMRRANQYFKASAERLTQLERVVDKVGGPEKVYAAVMSGTQDGGTTLRAVMQSLPSEGRRAVTAAVIKRMGLATKGQQDASGEVFSAQTFITNWNNVSKEAKRALFDRHGPRFVADMDKIARVADSIRKGSKVFANPAGTANKAAALTYSTSLGGSILLGMAGVPGAAASATALASGGLVANRYAHLMTNPRFVEWLARSTELPMSTLPAQLVMLKGIADRSGDDEMRAFAEELRQQQVQKPNH